MKNIDFLNNHNFGDMLDAIRAENINLKGRTWQSVVKLSNEWHPTKNGTLTPNNVFPNSRKKYWWIYSNGHEW